MEQSEKIFKAKIQDSLQILGVIRFGKSEDAVTESTGEVYILYVKPDKKRNGIGTQLLIFAKKQLQNMGYNKMIIWCLKGNKQGSNFYKKAGGHKENERESVVNGIKVREEGFYYDLTNLQ